jgi:hypothetical protein
VVLNRAWKSGRIQNEGVAGFPPEAACSEPVEKNYARCEKAIVTTHQRTMNHLRDGCKYEVKTNYAAISTYHFANDV